MTAFSVCSEDQLSYCLPTSTICIYINKQVPESEGKHADKKFAINRTTTDAFPT